MSSTSQPTSLTASTTSTSSSSTSSSAVPSVAAGSSHGISPSTLGAILGSILGALLLLILLVIILILRRARRRVDNSDQPSSSFWNRSTTLMSLRRNNKSTLPIWTGWEMVDPEDLRHPHSPGEGSPRGSGDEADPFLTRHSVRSGTEMAQTRTDTDTLVSLPAIARTGSVRSAAKPAEHIIPREVQMRLDEEGTDIPPYASVRMVERRSPDDHESPLLPPPPFNVAGARPSSHPSLTSQKSKAARSITSERSAGSNATDVQEPEGAELLTARRVRVGQVQPFANVGASTSTSTPPPPTVSGLDRLASLGRMSWFKRMSFLGPHSDAQLVPTTEDPADTYTRTPPRHSRAGSRSQPSSPSRPSSFAARISAHEPTTDSFGRRVRQEALAGERPISSVSAQSAASGNTVFYDATSRPGSSMGTRSTQGSGPSPVPPVPAVPPAHLPTPSPLSQEVHRHYSPESTYSENSGDHPPTYDAANPGTGVAYSNLDVLDMPAPRPASPFSAASGSRMSPPGLSGIPNPAVWRDSHASSSSPNPTDGTSVVNIDILEDAPPAADGTWRTLAGGTRPMDGRRLTFGVVSSNP